MAWRLRLSLSRPMSNVKLRPHYPQALRRLRAIRTCPHACRRRRYRSAPAGSDHTECHDSKNKCFHFNPQLLKKEAVCQYRVLVIQNISVPSSAWLEGGMRRTESVCCRLQKRPIRNDWLCGGNGPASRPTSGIPHSLCFCMRLTAPLHLSGFQHGCQR